MRASRAKRSLGQSKARGETVYRREFMCSCVQEVMAPCFRASDTEVRASTVAVAGSHFMSRVCFLSEIFYIYLLLLILLFID